MTRFLKAHYWRVVRACLVEFAGETESRAEARVKDFRSSLEAMACHSNDPLAAEMIYHDEAFRVARDLSGGAWDDANETWQRYWMLLGRLDRKKKTGGLQKRPSSSQTAVLPEKMRAGNL